MSDLARNQQVHTLIAAGKAAQALAIARRLIQSAGARPSAPAADAMRAALQATGQTEQALHYARLAVQADPASIPLRRDLARVHNLLAQLEDEARILEGVLKDAPDDPDHYWFLASAYERDSRLDDAERIARQGHARFPDAHEILMRLASAVSAQGRPGEAVALYRRALFTRPADLELASCLGPTLQYEYPADPAALRAVHENYGRLLEQADLRTPAAHARPSPPPPDTGPGRPLRVGFLSSDLRSHSVAAFATPLFEHLDPADATPVAYMTGFSLDEFSARLRRAVERAGGAFRHVVDQTDDAIARHIQADRIDVLVEMNGLTRDRRLDVVRLKPAPVIAHWCGYPSTTGVRTIDYRVVDMLTDPPGAERWMTERLLRIDPCFTCFDPPSDAPTPTPSTPGAPVTFGSFNMIQKVNDGVLRLWARLLREAPHARLLIKAVLFWHESVRQRVRERFVAQGGDGERLDLVAPTAERRDHLATYHRVDVALDTFPYAGTTTTCEALWMGVPVVTLAPPDGLHAARVGASLLSAAGHPEWIAQSDDEYIRFALALADDPARRAALRATLREQVRASALCNGPAFARRFTAALTRAWTAWARAEPLA